MRQIYITEDRYLKRTCNRMLSVNEPTYIKKCEENHTEGYTPKLNSCYYEAYEIEEHEWRPDFLLYFSRFNFYFVFNISIHVYSF